MDLNTPFEASSSSNVRELIQFFSENPASSLQEIRDRGREAILASMSLEDRLVVDSSTGFSNQILPTTTSPTPLVRPVLVGNFSQFFRICDPSNSLFLFVADSMVFAMSLCLYFPLSLSYFILAAINQQEFPFSNDRTESSSSSTNLSFNLPNRSTLRLLMWDVRDQSTSRLLGHLVMLSKIYQPTCFVLLLSDSKIGEEVARGLGIKTFGILPGSGSFPPILFFWNDTCFFSVTQLAAESITLSVYVSPQAIPTRILVHERQGPRQSTANRPWLSLFEFSSLDRLQMAMGGPSSY